MTYSASQNDLTWILDDLVEVPDVVYAVVLSTDGLIVQKSTSLPQDAGELLAAGASSLHSIAAGMGRRFDSGPVQQVIIEYEGRTLFVAAAGQNARLAVLCEQSVDMGTVAYEMSRLVTRIGDYLGSEVRLDAMMLTDRPGLKP
ncbi:Predicted regulator of Ras-like GTPase activity, Roadblock/LC7/MglB family [Micromonospora matsumotoense]|uniref:Predicted regulator of Ras-like GTPase activity, Roadblock/LC7/MglB family n=1 Tax=Micromonospora matsumotoense TaxID=121616 RepID=A0A1C4XMX0_9ACTN|nr:roadblock/LC7 domain-containing protein [Micromonospora matsumotoense]SCF09763.1 Predicted regulator of Ras-like GTPase activity, Roadblock/LC7/MglB family [Micromonospora matsumotoense]